MSRESISATKASILKKRRLQRQRRRIRFFRLIILLVFLGLVGTALLFVGYNVYSWGSSAYHELMGMYADYEERREARGGMVSENFAGYTNVLILGLDDGANNEGDLEQRADTIMLLSLANDSGRLRVITIPPTTWVRYPGGQEGTMTDLYALGGANAMVRATSELLGVSVHQFMAVDMHVFSRLIDTLGGLEIYVEADMDYDDPEAELSIHLPKGYQHLDGDTAQKYLRFRSSDLGDVGRVQRQQKFVKILYQKLLQLETVPKLPAIADIFKTSVTTSAEIFDSAHLASVLRHLNSEPPQTIMLPGELADGEEGIWLVDSDALKAKMTELFPQEQPGGE
ncbi:MAG: LCP family protein [Selenomonadaceae bacterium]|nr:LCP family protein [Selenomonadaceae bacterium]